MVGIIDINISPCSCSGCAHEYSYAWTGLCARGSENHGDWGSICCSIAKDSVQIDSPCAIGGYAICITEIGAGARDGKDYIGDSE